MTEITVGKEILLVPESGSPCDLWKTFFKKLKGMVGKENAKMIWLVTWSSNGSVSCTTNADFNKWLAQNDIDVSSAATRAVADLSEVGSNVLGLGKNLTKVLSVGVPVALGAILLVIIWLLYKTGRDVSAKELVQAAAMKGVPL